MTTHRTRIPLIQTVLEYSASRLRVGECFINFSFNLCKESHAASLEYARCNQLKVISLQDGAGKSWGAGFPEIQHIDMCL